MSAYVSLGIFGTLANILSTQKRMIVSDESVQPIVTSLTQFVQHWKFTTDLTKFSGEVAEQR